MGLPDIEQQQQAVSNDMNCSLPLTTPPPEFVDSQLHCSNNINCVDLIKHYPSSYRPSSFPTLAEPDSSVTPVLPLYYVHPYPLHVVVKGFFNKYPTPAFPELLYTRVLNELHDPDTGVIYRRRAIVIRNTMPFLFRRLLGGETFEFHEDSLYDPKSRVFELSSRNHSFSSIVSCTEQSKFFEIHHNGKNQTCFIQTGGVRAGSLFGPLRNRLEQFVSPRVRKAGVEATLLLQRQLEEKFSEYPH